MNLDALWQRNRTYVLGLAGAVIAFFLLHWILTRGANARLDSAQRSINSIATEMRAATYGAAQEREAAARLETLRQRNADFARRSLPPVRAAYRLPPNKAAAQHYIEVTGALRQELVAWALREDCEVDASLGLPPVSPVQAPQVARVLAGLDVVERVVRLAVLNGASSVEKISISDRARGGSNRSKVLDLTPVQMEITFTGRSPAPFLRALLAASPDGPFGLSGFEVAAQGANKRERRLLLEFDVGSLPELQNAEAAP